MSRSEAVTTPGRWVSLDWARRTTGATAPNPSPAMDNRSIAFPRGRVQGGCSAINAMAFVRGDSRCFDRWRELGNPGWGYDEVLPLFKRLEKNETGASEYRGGDGPLAVSGCYDPHAAHRAFLSAAYPSGYKSDARFDFNGPLPQGVAGYLQKNILDGKRHSAAAAFLVPALSRPNLVVQPGATATRVIVERGRAVGVEFVRNGQREHNSSGARSCSVRRRDQLTAAADALGNRSGRPPSRPRCERGGRRRRGRRQPAGSPQALGPLAGQDGAAGIDGHRRALHPTRTRWTRPGCLPTCSSTSGAASRRRTVSSRSRRRSLARDRAVKSGCARRIRWQRRSSGRTTCRRKPTCGR